MMDQKKMESLIDERIEKQMKEIYRMGGTNFSFPRNSEKIIDAQNIIGITGNRIEHETLRLHTQNATIVSGAIQYKAADTAVFTQSAASSDDLDTVAPPMDIRGGELLLLRAGNDAQTVVVKHNTGNLWLLGAADFSMDTNDDRILLEYDKAQGFWIEIARNDDIPYAALTLTGSIVNADISASAAIDASKTTLGAYTDWTSWTPSYSASGSMTWTSVSTVLAIYCKIGGTIFFQINAIGTTGGTADKELRFTPPVTPANTTASNVGGGCYINEGGSAPRSALFASAAGGSPFRVFRYDYANYGLGTTREINVQGHYEV